MFREWRRRRWLRKHPEPPPVDREKYIAAVQEAYSKWANLSGADSVTEWAKIVRQKSTD